MHADVRASENLPVVGDETCGRAPDPGAPPCELWTYFPHDLSRGETSQKMVQVDEVLDSAPAGPEREHAARRAVGETLDGACRAQRACSKAVIAGDARAAGVAKRACLAWEERRRGYCERLRAETATPFELCPSQKK